MYKDSYKKIKTCTKIFMLFLNLKQVNLIVQHLICLAFLISYIVSILHEKLVHLFFCSVIQLPGPVDFCVINCP